MADESAKTKSSTELYTRQLESQLSDLKFLISQYSHQVDAEKKKTEHSLVKVQDVFGRLSNEQRTKPEKIFQKLQKIDLETGLEPLLKPPLFFAPPDPAISDIVRLAQSRIDTLETENRGLINRESELQNDVCYFLLRICLFANNYQREIRKLYVLVRS
jgi:hypothetical protein